MKTLHCIYDLEVSPCTFDVIKFFVLSSNEIQQRKFSHAILHIIYPSESRMRELQKTFESAPDTESFTKYFERRVENILASSSELFPFIKETHTHYFRNTKDLIFKGIPTFPERYSVESSQAHYGLGNIFQLLGRGYPPKSIKVLNYIEKKLSLLRGALIITIRKTQYHTSRNSEINQWISFAEKRLREGYKVGWLLDVESECLSKRYLPGLIIDEDSVVSRAWIYQNAKASFFVNSGMAALARFNHHAVSACFKLLDETASSATKHFWLSMGIKPGQQFDFLSPLHHQCWEEDSFENIETVWRQKIKPLTLLSKNQRTQIVDNWYREVESRKNLHLVECETININIETYVWGVSDVAQELVNALRKNGTKVVAMVDSFNHDQVLCDCMVIHPCDLSLHSDKNLVLVPLAKDGAVKMKELILFIRSHFYQNARLIDFRDLRL